MLWIGIGGRGVRRWAGLAKREAASVSAVYWAAAGLRWSYSVVQDFAQMFMCRRYCSRLGLKETSSLLNKKVFNVGNGFACGLVGRAGEAIAAMQWIECGQALFRRRRAAAHRSGA